MKSKILRGLWNRLTKYSLISVVLAIIFFTLGLVTASTIWFASIASILLFTSILIESVGFYKTRRFSAEKATEIYREVTRLIQELRSLSQVLHENYDYLENSNKRYASDKRYKNIMGKFNYVLTKCYDYGLYRRISKLIESERIMAKYRINPGKNAFIGGLESADRNIIDYIRLRLQ